MNLKKQLKKMKKDQERYEELVKKERSTCPHIGKKGTTWLDEFTEEGTLKGKCKECGDVVILDEELLTNSSITLSVEVVKTILAELRAYASLRKIELTEKTMKDIVNFDANVLRKLPKLMQTITEKKKGKKKKKKKGKTKRNKRQRWS